MKFVSPPSRPSAESKWTDKLPGLVHTHFMEQAEVGQMTIQSDL